MILQFIVNIARFHPLVVHMPIGILFFAFLLFIIKIWKKDASYDSAIRVALGVATLSSFAAIGTGWLLSNEGGYEASALNWHKYMGIATAVTCLVLYFASNAKEGILAKLYGPMFFVSIGLLTATGHFGGNLTHGSDYLFSAPESESINIVDIESAVVYDDLVRPILKTKCMGCHNPSKVKGELLMTTPEDLMKGGENGVIIDLENPDESEMIKRVHLPLNEKKHMPPKGKRQLEDDEIELIQWWLSNKACFECKVADLEKSEEMQALLDNYGKSTVDPRLASLESISGRTIQKLLDQGLDVSRLSEQNDFVSVRLKNNTVLDAGILNNLKDIKNNVLELDLSGSNLKDDMTSVFSDFTNIEKIQLQRSAIGDKTLNHLKELKYLRSLNLYETEVTDEGLASIKEIENLQNLYLWKSKVSDTGVKDLNDAREDITINFNLDDNFFGLSSLSIPEIVAPGNIFVNSVEVRVTPPFKGADLYYTLDGSEPDSSSTKYEDPIQLYENTLIKTIALKDGWLASPIAELQVVKTGYKIRGITLSSQPSVQYKGKGNKTLIDLNKGSEDFRDGEWLGYEGENLEVVLELEDERLVKEVLVSSISDPGSWIFYPKSVSISLSSDGSNFKSSEKMLVTNQNKTGKEQQIIDLAFTPAKAKYIKVKIQSMLKNPSWHTNPGEKSWLFVDEIFVN